MSLNLVHMTAEYSNAVLVAIMPHVSDFAAKMELPIPQPITISHVKRANALPSKCPVGAGIWLTNGYWFNFQSRGDNPLLGYVFGYSAPTNAFKEHEFSEKSVPRYFGTDHMTTNEAIVLARATLLKAGYEPRITHADKPPTRVDGPFDWEQPKGHVSYCEVEWSWPSAEEEPDHLLKNHNTMTVQINLETKSAVGMLCIFGANNPPPLVYFKPSIEPELEVDFQKRTRQKIFTDTDVRTQKP